MIPEDVQQIKDWLIPKTDKEVSMFLGFAEYFHPAVFSFNEPIESDKECEEVQLEHRDREVLQGTEESIHAGRYPSVSLLGKGEPVHTNIIGVRITLLESRCKFKTGKRGSWDTVDTAVTPTSLKIRVCLHE